MKGLFVTFEGIDGSGKTLMIEKAAQALRGLGHSVLCTREPGGSPAGQQLRQIILNSPRGSIDDRAEALLYAADRALHVAQVIRPALEAGQIVLCDRYIDSTYAYQGGGRQISQATLTELNRFASYGLQPALTLLLDIDPALALTRSRGERDRIEQEDMHFFYQTADAYRQLAAADPARFRVVDATMRIEDESALILRLITERLEADHA